MTYDWYDRYDVAGENLQRLLHRQKLEVGGEHEPREVTIEKMIGVTVGIDSTGLWACVEVATLAGERFSLYTDGNIHNSDDDPVGKHDFKTGRRGDGPTFIDGPCGHDGWVKGCPQCEANERAAAEAMGDR